MSYTKTMLPEDDAPADDPTREEMEGWSADELTEPMRCCHCQTLHEGERDAEMEWVCVACERGNR